MSTAILILNYNNAADTVRCIRSILDVNTATVKFIIVDNGSTKEGTVETVDRYLAEQFGQQYSQFGTGGRPIGVLPPASVLLNPSNEGYAVGNNHGLRWIYEDPEIDSILLLNNDVLFTGDIIPVLKRDALTLKACGIVTPLLYKKDGKTIDSCCARRFVSNWNVMVPFLLHNRDWFHWITKNYARQDLIGLDPGLTGSGRPFPIDYPSGSCLFIDKDLFRAIGSFDPNTFLYYEEIILYKKLQAAGKQNYCDPTVQAIHLGGSSTRMSDNSFLQRCNLESADVYFRDYGKCSRSQKAVWALTRCAWRLRLRLKRFKR